MYNNINIIPAENTKRQDILILTMVACSISDGMSEMLSEACDKMVDNIEIKFSMHSIVFISINLKLSESRKGLVKAVWFRSTALVKLNKNIFGDQKDTYEYLEESHADCFDAEVVCHITTGVKKVIEDYSCLEENCPI